MDKLLLELRQTSNIAPLQSHIQLLSRDISSDAFTKYINDFNRRIFELIHSSDSSDRHVGILCIEALLDDDMSKLTRFANYLRTVIPTDLDSIRVLGKLASYQGSSEFVEFELKRALEWDKDKRLNAVLIIKELSRNAPTVVYQYTNQLIDLLTQALRDTRIPVREASSDSLNAVLDMAVVERRDTSIIKRIKDEIQRGYKLNTQESIHGSLLMTQSLVKQLDYKETMETILKYKDMKDPIKRQVLLLIGEMSGINTNVFIQDFLHLIMNYLLNLIKKEKLCFIIIGKVTINVQSSISPYLDAISLAIKQELKKKYDEVFECISMLVASVGNAMQKYLQDLDLFQSGLSLPLMEALKAIRKYIPQLEIQHKLINIISLNLSSSTDILLSLIVLGEYDFTINLNVFIKSYLLKYLFDTDSKVRKQAGLTISKLVVPSADSIEIIDKLLSVGVGDLNADIRSTILNEFLNPKYDAYLINPYLIKLLFISLNDEVYEIRESALQILGRLNNPAYILPSLRNYLIQLLVEIEYSQSSRGREEASRLLCLLIKSSSSRLIRPYVESILRVLLAAQPSQEIFLCLGQLSRVGDVSNYLSKIVPLLVTSIQDQSNSGRRECALIALGQLVSNTNYVIDIYLEYPQLLNLLLQLLKTEQIHSIRMELIRLMGILGALDPYRYQLPSKQKEQQLEEFQQLDDYYSQVSLVSLIRILKDQSLSVHHTQVVQAIMYIIKTNQLKSIPLLELVMNPFLQLLKQQPLLEYNIQQLCILIQVVGVNIKPYLPQIIQLIKDNYTQNTAVIIQLIEQLGLKLESEFKVYLLGDLIQIILQLTGEMRMLNCLCVIGGYFEDYLHLIVPSLLKIVSDSSETPLRQKAIYTLTQLCKKLDLSLYSSRIIHLLLKNIHVVELQKNTIDLLCQLIYQLQQDFVVYIPIINQKIKGTIVDTFTFDLLTSKLLKHEPLPQLEEDKSPAREEEQEQPKKLPVNQQHLKKAWETSQKSTREDWQEWIRRLSVELLKESPSHALRACANLASVYYPLAKELFNYSFTCCWTELYDQFQDELVKSLEQALTAASIPPEVLQTILNLAEFLEHDDKQLPIDMKVLGAYAAKCHAYAKALHYKEQEQPSLETTEALISINNQLQQPDAAIGILKTAQINHQLKEGWYEKLNRWEDALEAYEVKIKESDNEEYTLGKMRCLHALGEWEQLSILTQQKWMSSDAALKKTLAPLGSAAAWGMGQWELMDDYLEHMQNSQDGFFFKSILSIHRNEFNQAQAFITRTREMLDTELKALVGESYQRAYNLMVRVQMLSELEEIVVYKQSERERREQIRATWMKRLTGCQRNVEVWQRVLKVRALVISPREDLDMWIKFANLCRKSQRMITCQKILQRLEGDAVDYAYMKYMWSQGQRQEAFDKLRGLVERLTDSELLSKCFVKLGQWKNELVDHPTEHSIKEVLNYSNLAIKHSQKGWYKAWHAFALANFEMVSLYEKSPALNQYVCAAIRGFFKSIYLSKNSSLQDTLRLLTLWFKYGFEQEVSQSVGEGFTQVPIDTWLQVIPQLIARIHAPSVNVRRLVHQLLSEVGKEHPQALIYSLTVASKSQQQQRQESALGILDKMRVHSPKLVEQAVLVSQELIRVAILWQEMWHEGLEEASRLYFGEHKVEEMFQVLEPLHQLIEKGAETLREVSFNQAYGRDLKEALEWCAKYKQHRQENDLHQAWDLYYHVFRKINKQLPSLTTIELQYVSPQLMNATNLELAVPGTYKSGSDVVRIAGFQSTLSVITSKQRPRKISIKGSDGLEYQYLLKGHEDLRQDERVMQLFGLVNTLLEGEPETFKRHLSIHRYPVIPLSPNSGLLGWVANCDTLHSLIRDFRESKKVLLNIEHRLMLQMAPDYDNLTLMQKVEVFQYALDQTTGQDLAKVLWLKSKNSESWLERRTTYTRSLAVMSMVGYVLGLGDRHPSNLMLERNSGKVIHIDFGDCFEVAMQREKFPERIPFRLTRMLVSAMEVSGIEGSFRITCENVMRVLRENKESLMAVLEAFVHDPLINWRFKDKPEEEEVEVNETEALNARGLAIVKRIENKLTGRDFRVPLEVDKQVDKLIQQATSVENLCQCYIGWCPFW